MLGEVPCRPFAGGLQPLWLEVHQSAHAGSTHGAQESSLGCKACAAQCGPTKAERFWTFSVESVKVSLLMWHRASSASCGSREPLIHCAGIQQRRMRDCCDVGAVLGDVSLVWQNCRGFNAEGSDIHAMADEAEAHFVQLWARKDLPFEATGPPAAPPGAGQHGSAQVLTGEPSSAMCIQWATPLKGTWGAHGDASEDV